MTGVGAFGFLVFLTLTIIFTVVFGFNGFALILAGAAAGFGVVGLWQGRLTR